MRSPDRIVMALLGAVVCAACGGAAPPASSSAADPPNRQTAAPPPQTSVVKADAPPDEAPTAPKVAPTPTEETPEEAPEEIDDGFDEAVVGGEARAHPLAHLSDAEIAERVATDLASLGSMSVGRPSGGRLFNAVQMPEGPHWRLVDREECWGTEETVENLQRAIQAVIDQFPGTPPLPIGHISAKHGGPLRPHISHQSGRDVDIGYYYRGEDSWYRRAHAGNLDVERTWALVRAFVVLTDVELILIDRRLQTLLRQHAKEIGEPEPWLEDLFRGNGPRGPLIRHARGHSTHMHVRFFNPTARETARRCISAMVAEGLIEEPVHYVHHRVRKGETLGKLAKRYGTTVRAIQRANGLRSTLIQAKKTYRIPRTGPPPGHDQPIRVPARRLPGS